MEMEIQRRERAAKNEGMAQGMINAIRNLMKNADITAEKTMTMLGVAPADFGKYLPLL